MKAIVTVAPYAPFMNEVARHPSVSGLRLNTVMPVKKSDSLEDVLKRMQDNANGKELWIDLKGRQLRVEGYWTPPFTEIALSHKISVNTPVNAIFSDHDYATVIAVEGNRLIMQDGPQRVIGPGESVNIISPSLKIEGYFTDTDLKYIEAGQKTGIKNYMLSFVENNTDIAEMLKLFPDSNLVAKIESQKGLAYVSNEWSNGPRLMAARGDLYNEVRMPHQIAKACELIVSKDKDAVVASRILESFAESPEPSCSDIMDVYALMKMGYQNFMFGDQICLKRDSIMAGLECFRQMGEMYK
jgi:hypothetical protein